MGLRRVILLYRRRDGGVDPLVVASAATPIGIVLPDRVTGQENLPVPLIRPHNLWTGRGVSRDGAHAGRPASGARGLCPMSHENILPAWRRSVATSRATRPGDAGLCRLLSFCLQGFRARKGAWTRRDRTRRRSRSASGGRSVRVTTRSRGRTWSSSPSCSVRPRTSGPVGGCSTWRRALTAIRPYWKGGRAQAGGGLPEGDAGDLPFSASFDYVLSALGAMFVPDHEARERWYGASYKRKEGHPAGERLWRHLRL